MTRYSDGKVHGGGRSRSDFAGSVSRKQRRGKVGRTEPSPALVLIFSDDLVDLSDMPKAIFGQYPQGVGFIERVLPWLLCTRREILHVCSGALPPGEGIRVDIRPDAKPDILADGRALPLADGSVAAVMIDPPYTEEYAQKLFGVDYPRPAHLLKEAARVVRPGGRITMLHYIVPKPVPGTRVVRVFGVSMGFNYPIRALTIYERAQPRLL